MAHTWPFVYTGIEIFTYLHSLKSINACLFDHSAMSGHAGSFKDIMSCHLHFTSLCYFNICLFFQVFLVRGFNLEDFGQISYQTFFQLHGWNRWRTQHCIKGHFPRKLSAYQTILKVIWVCLWSSQDKISVCLWSSQDKSSQEG